MSLLHTVNKSPFSHNTLNACIKVIQPGDALLLLEDGVYGSLTCNPLAEELITLHEKGTALFALAEDIQARGILGRQIPAITNINYNRFVELCTQHHSVQSWY